MIVRVSILFAMVLLASSLQAQTVEDCVVKLYGEGGMQGIEGYQTGLFVSADGEPASSGLILTVDSPVVGGRELLAVLANGDRYSARVRSVDPRWEIAWLEIDLDGETHSTLLLDPNGLELHDLPGHRVYAVSNAFNIAAGKELVSRQRATIAAVTEVDFIRLNRSLDRPTVLLLDAVVSNPGAAGGAVVDPTGRLLGMIGKESRSRKSGRWLNYAIPTQSLYESMRQLQENVLPEFAPTGSLQTARSPGKLFGKWGIAMAPMLGPKMPPMVEFVRKDSVAFSAGVRADDLVVSVNGSPVQTVTEVEHQLLPEIDSRSTLQNKPFRLTLLRGEGLRTVMLKERE